MLGGTGAADLARGSLIGVPGVQANGKTPVHADVSYSFSLSTAKPVRVFADTSTSGTASTMVAFNSFSLGGRTAFQRSRATYSTNLRMASSLSSALAIFSAVAITTTER